MIMNDFRKYATGHLRLNGQVLDVNADPRNLDALVELLKKM